MNQTSKSGLEVKNLSKIFGNQKPVLENFSYSFEPKKFYGLLGPSGCGKTTLIRILAGLEIPNAGVISFEDQIWNQDQNAQLFCTPESRNIGFVFQNFALWPHMTVFENVSFPLMARKKNIEEMRKRAEEILTKTEILDLWNRYPHTLSGGQCQRVALARALITDPKILFLDEPFSALDASLRAGLRGELRSLHKSWGGLSIIVTHDWSDVESLCDEVIVLDKGIIVQKGNPEAIQKNPVNVYVSNLTMS